MEYPKPNQLYYQMYDGIIELYAVNDKKMKDVFCQVHMYKFPDKDKTKIYKTCLKMLGGDMKTAILNIKHNDDDISLLADIMTAWQKSVPKINENFLMKTGLLQKESTNRWHNCETPLERFL